MKKLSLVIFGLLIIPLFLFTSCDTGDDVVVSEPSFSILKSYMIENQLDASGVLSSSAGTKFVVAPPTTAADVPAFLSKFNIIDIRGAADYANGHIDGAVNVKFENILTATSSSKPTLVVCYSGQTACYATALLRMYGQSETQALKWGMSGWNSTTAGSWNNNIGNVASGNANWTFDAAPANLTFSDPVFSSISVDGNTILKKRVEYVVSQGFKNVSASDVVNNPGNYFINNYFNNTDYIGFGHIKGAYRVNPLLLSDNSYQKLDPTAGAKVVTYCYTGQTSAVMTAWLNVIGYDAYSLLFGMNGLNNENGAWSSNKWSAAVSKEYELVN
ncbi:MAG: hypothetical protein COB60_02985 [Flavobacteriaceae bacterium]|nr:MAG: hypothetical protein COB60_02985 [Flavobacteriaceae bacterium]